MNYKGLIYGIILIAIALLVGWLWHFFKALKDPDVIAAADLRMDIRRYRFYRGVYDELQEIIKINGADSPYAEEFFRTKILPRIKNPNEWRRYQAYRLEKQQEVFQKELKGK